MKLSTYLIIFIFSTPILISCGSDDNMDIPFDDDMGFTLEEERALTITDLTGNNTKLWKIGSASLTNSNGTYDVSNQYNIIDDEFLFTGDASGGTLTWSPGFDINLGANSVSSTAIDYYLSPTEYTFEFNEDSPNVITSVDGQFVFTVTDDQTISGTITFVSRSMAGEELLLTLNPKTPDDFVQTPANGLNFSLVTTTTSSGLFYGEGSGGMIGSYSENSLYLVDRLDGNPAGSEEQIMKYNLNTGAWTTNVYLQSQFITKRLNIINNELVVFGGQIASTYPLIPNGAPTSEFTHDLDLTRFGFAVQGDKGYIVGNDATSWNQPAKVRSYDYISNQITDITTLPNPRVYAGAEIVNNELYVFGGRNDFAINTYDSLEGTCYKVNLATGTITNFAMPALAPITYAAKIENLIYVFYETRTDDDADGDLSVDPRTMNFAVYNTLDDSFAPISHDLDDTDISSSVHAISIFNGKLYVAYGSATGGLPVEIKIFSALL